MSKYYTVWVGGTEVLDYYTTKDKAEEVKESWVENGYEAIVEHMPFIPLEERIKSWTKKEK